MSHERTTYPLQSHITVYGNPLDYLSGGIRGGGDRFLSAALDSNANHGWPVELVTNAPDGDTYQAGPETKATMSGNLYVRPGVVKLDFTPERRKGDIPRLLTDEDMLERASIILGTLLRNREHRYAIPIAHHYTSAYVLGTVLHLDKPVVVVPHALNIFRDREHGGDLNDRRLWSSDVPELYSLFRATLIVLPTYAEKANMEAMWLKVRQGSQTPPELQQAFQRMLGRCVIIPWGVDHALFNPNLQIKKSKLEARKKLGLPLSSELMFGVVGRVVPLKNIETAIDAFSAVMAAYPGRNLNLVIFGGDIHDLHERNSYMRELQRRVSKKNPEVKLRIIFSGTHDPVDIMAAIDVHISASFSESWGLAVTEAMATGIPSIVSDNSVMQEVTNGKQLYFDPHNYRELAKHMIELIKHQDLAQAVGRQGAQVAQRYSWTNTTAELMHHIINLGVARNTYTLSSLFSTVRRFPMSTLEQELFGVCLIRRSLIQTSIESISSQITQIRQPLHKRILSALSQDADFPDVKAAFEKIEQLEELSQIFREEEWLAESMEIALGIGDLDLVDQYISDNIKSFEDILQRISATDSQRSFIEEAISSWWEMKTLVGQIAEQRRKKARQIYPLTEK